MNPLLIGVLILVVIGVVFLLLSARQRSQAGIPPGRVIYDDSGTWREANKPLFDAFFGITGKPDYILEKDDYQIPVEVKSASAPSQPYEGHRYQLAMYCLLIERTTGKRPPYGILRYNNRTFAVDYTPELEADLVKLLGEMRQVESAYRPSTRRGLQGAPRSHESPQRCRVCGYRSTCDQFLSESKMD